MDAVPTRAEVDRLMKRCQVGVGGGNAWNEAHSIMSECYGKLGALMLAVERLSNAAANARALAASQAEDEGLWFMARTAPEAYLQAALRALHAAVEGDGIQGLARD